LKTLTGDQPQITLPILPPSSNATPRPDPFNWSPSAPCTKSADLRWLKSCTGSIGD